jgi:hypothetical protein
MAAEPEVKVKITADADGVVVATNSAGESVKKFGRSVKTTQEQSLRSLSSFASRVAPEFARISTVAALEIRRTGWSQGLTGALRELNVFDGATSKLFEDIRQNVASKLKGLGDMAKMAFQGLTAGAAVGAGAFAVSSVRAAADAQKLQLRLETLARSAGHVADAADVAKAKMAFLEELDKVASSDLPTLTEAGAALEAYRLPMEGFLPLAGDFSAAMGANLEDVARGVGKAMQGQAEGFEVLGNLGVTKQDLYAAGAHRNQDGSMALKGAEDQAAARQALVTILQRYRGGMERESKSIEGAFSMISSSWNLLQRAAAEPFSSAIQSAALATSNFLDRTTAFVKWLEQSGGGIAAWVASAGGMGATFAGLGVVMTSTLVAIGGPLLAFLGTLGKVGLMARTFSLLFGAIAGWAPKLGFLGTVGTWLGGIASKAGLVQAVVIALGTTLTTTLLAAFAVVGTVAAAFAVAWWRDWGGIRDKTAAAVEWIRNATVNGFRMLSTQAVAIWEATKAAVVRVLVRLEAEAKPAVEALVAWWHDNWPTVKSIVLQTMNAVAAIVAATAKGLQVAFAWIRDNVLPVWQSLWHNLKNVVVFAWKIISTAVSSMINAVDTTMRVGMEHIHGNWRGAWEELKQGMERQFDPINVALRRLIVSLLETIQGSLPQFGLAGQAISHAISQGIREQEGAIDRLEARIVALNSRKTTASPTLVPFLSLLNQLGKAPANTQQPKQTQTPQGRAFDYDGFLQDFQGGAGQDEDPAKGARRKTTRTSSKLTTSQMLAYIRANSDVRTGIANIANMQAASIEATYNLVQNATAEGIRLVLTSGKRYGDGRSHHDAGNALDVQVPGYAKGSTEAGAVVRALAKGTGWMSGINEYLPEALAVTNGSGPHVHLARALDGVGVPGHFRVEKGGKGAGAAEYRRALEELQRWREQVRALGQDHETLAGKLAEVDARFAKMATEGQALGASQGDLAKVEAERQAERGKLLAEQAEKERALLAEMSAERLDLTADETEREREELRKRFEAMVDHWQKVAVETPALAAQVEQQIALVRKTYRDQRAEFERKAEEKRVQDAQATWEQKHQKELESHEFLLKMGQETNAGLLAFLAQQLEAWQGTEEGKRALALRYREAFLEDLRVRRQAQDAYDVADLERELAQLQAKTELTVTEEIRRDALLAEVQEAQLNRLAEMRQRAQDVADTLRNSFQQSFTAVLSGQQTLGQGIKGVWDAVKQAFLQAIAEMITETKAFQAVLLMLKALMNSIGGIFGGLFGFHTGGVVEASGMPYAVAHTGGLLGPGGELQSFHSGGSVGPIRLRPDEVLAKLQTGEIVLSRDNVRSLGSAGSASSGGGVSVVINAPGLVVREEADISRIARALGGEAQWRLGVV